MAEILTHARFGGSAQALRDQGLEVREHQDFSDITLAEPGYGETVIGELTDDEKLIYAELMRAHQEVERLSREYIARSLERFGGAIRATDASKGLHEQLKQEDVEMTFGDAEEKLAFFRLQRKVEVLRAQLWWGIGERFHKHDWSMSIRTKFRVVTVREKA